MPAPGNHPAASVAPQWATHGKVPRLDRFLLGPEIGRGAMGRVVRAWDPMLRRVVAVKLLLQEDPMEMARFLHEAQLQAGIDHPNVCRVYEVGSSMAQPYIAMQLIDGHTLDFYHGRFSVEEVARILADVAAAIHAAHLRGLIHRDIKPSNILLEPTADGHHRPYIMDFGLARRLGEGTDAGVPWDADGTPAFMSPEQARGEAIGPASDIYSMGATLFACLCGEPPREPIAPLELSRARDLRLLHLKRPELSPDLEAVLLRCLHPEPQRRYASAGILEEELRAWLAGKPVRASRPGLVPILKRSLRRNRGLWLASLASMLALGGMLGWHMRVRGQGRAMLEMTTRFLLDVSLEESLLGRERLLPAHDIRPALERARSRIATIERDMARIGGPALAPGHYAIGRVYLDLGELDKAEQHLQDAWNRGLNTPDVAATLGIAKAQRHFEDVDQLLLKQPENLAEQLRELRQARLLEIESYLRKAPREGTSTRHLAQGEAFLAMARGEYALAAQRFRQASSEAPWYYEAFLLEARALELLDDTGGAGEATLRRARWEACLDHAFRLAGSDDRVYAAQIRRHVRLGRIALRRGESAEPHFRRARDIHEQSRVVRADSPHTTAAMLSLLGITLQGRLEGGEDVREELAEVLERHRPAMDREGGLPILAGDVLFLAQMYAEQLYAHGADPRPWLDWAARHLVARDPLAWVKNRRLLAMVQIDLSQDPKRTFDAILQKLDLLRTTHGADVPMHVASGHTWLEWARWKRERGQPDLEPLLRAGEAFQAALNLQPGHSDARQSMLRFKAREAMALAAAQQDPEPVLREARGLLESGTSYPTYSGVLARAELHLAEAICRGGLQGRLSQAIVDEGQEAAAWLLAKEPSSVSNRALLGEYLLMQARIAQGQGRDPHPFLARVESLTREGLKQKADAVELKLLLARVAVFRVLRIWPTRTREGTEGFYLAVEAHQLAPGRPEAQWLKGLFSFHETREPSGLAEKAAAERAAPAAIARLLVTLPPLPAALRQSH